MVRLAVTVALAAIMGLAVGRSVMAEPITFTTSRFTLSLDGSGNLVSLIDRADSRNHAATPPSAFVMVRQGGELLPATSCVRTGDQLEFGFADPRLSVILEARAAESGVTFEVRSVHGDGITEVRFCRLQVDLNTSGSTLSGIISDGRFAAVVRGREIDLGFNYEAGRYRTVSLSALQGTPFTGHAALLTAGPLAEMPVLLREAMDRAHWPYTPTTGPAALANPEAAGSELFTSSLSEANADQWIDMARSTGVRILHLNEWEQTKGSYAPRAKLFPHGVQGLADVVDKIHRAGLLAGMHTLTGGIEDNDPLVFPSPPSDLAYDSACTLAGAIGPGDRTIAIQGRSGSEADEARLPGQGHVWQIDNELILTTRLPAGPAAGLEDCVRGALGTVASAHQSGAQVRHIRVRFGLFTALPGSITATRVAENIAAIYNTCKFDTIYMDGAEATSGGPQGIAWMRHAIASRLQRPAIIESSDWGYASWPEHSRLGAWDAPIWGVRQFADWHIRVLETLRATSALPVQLGWWSLFGPNEDHYAETPDEFEYILCRSLAYGMPLALQGIWPSRGNNQRQADMLAMMSQYEKLRNSHAVPEETLAKMRKPGVDFHLVMQSGKPTFTPVCRRTTVLQVAQRGSDWATQGEYSSQPAGIRVQSLYAAVPFDDPNGRDLLDPSAARASYDASPGFTSTMEPDPALQQANGATARITARGHGWARYRFAFQPAVSIEGCDAMGLWVHGDGRGEVLCFTLSNAPGHAAVQEDHYITVDFVGWRYFEFHFREREADRFGTFPWQKSDPQSVHRLPLVRAAIGSLTVCITNAPPDGEATVNISRVRALPVQNTHLEDVEITVGGNTLRLAGALDSGDVIEGTGPKDCRHYDERGQLKGTVHCTGAWPQLGSEPVSVHVAGRPSGPLTPRCRITLTQVGPPL